MKKAGTHTSKAYTTILLLLVVAFLSVLYYFITSIKHERQTEKLIQRTQTSIHLSNHLQRLSDTFHLLSAPLFYTDKKPVSTEQQRIGTLVNQQLIFIRNYEHIEPAQLAAIDSIEKNFNQLIHLIYDTVPGSLRRDQPPVMLRDEYKLSASAIQLFIGGIRNQEEENLLHYQENIKEDKYLLNLRIFLLLGIILLLSIIFTWQLWKNYKTNQKTAALQTYNNFLLSNIAEAIISTDLQDTILTWNQGAEAIFGWKKEEAIGKKRTELFPYDKSIDEYIQQDLSKDRTFFKGEVRQHDKAGNILYIRKTVSPVYNELHQHTGFVSISMDITASKEQEEAMKTANELLEERIRERTSNLMRANKLYHFISELNKMILQTTDEQTLFKEICDIAIHFGKFRMAWIGLIDTETGFVRPVIHSGNEEGYLSIIKPISIRADVPEGRGPTGLALREGTYFVCQDVEHDPRLGPWREEQLRRGYLSSMAVPIRKSGVITGAITVYAPEKNFFNEAEISLMLAAADDITFALDYLAREEQRLITENQLAESEEKFRTLVEKSLAGVYIIQDNLFTYINTRFAEIFGYDHPEDIMDKLGIEDLTAPSDLERVREQINNRMSGAINSVHYTTKVIRKDQSYLYIEVAGSYILYKNKPAILGTLFDITYQVEEEIRIGKAVINAQENERQQIGMELHDNVKQILAATQMYLGMANSKLDKTQQEVAGLLAKSRGFISDSILELRKLSHQLAPSTSGNISFEESIDMLVKNMNADQHMEVFLNIESFAPGLINKDILTTLYRILQEQLNNIKKYAAAKEVIISTSLSDDYIHLSITDNGKGFDPSTVKEGIGLENIRRRVKFFGGSVKVISSPGNGCEIQVDIPMQPLKE